MGNTPKWDRGAHLELSTDEKLDYLYFRDDAQQNEIDANKVKVTPATYPEGTETYNIATIKVGNTTKTLKGKEGGGGGSSDAFEVKFSIAWNQQTQSYDVTCDKTYSELNAAVTANKKIYAWMDVSDTEFLAVNYSIIDSSFYFVFVDDTQPASYWRVTITVDSESVSVDSLSLPQPVYASVTGESGYALDADTLNLYLDAINNGSYFYINISGGGWSTGAATFVFTTEYHGYCFAGPRDAIGYTAQIDSETGEITVTAPNS